MNFIFIGIFIGTIILEIYTKKKLTPGQISEDPLSGGEKTLIWIFCILNPFLAGAIFYYGWKNRLPVKAKAANRISWIAFGLSAVLLVITNMFGLI